MSTTTPRPLILISTGKDGDTGGKSNGEILESPPDSNGGFFSPIQIDLKTSTSKVSSRSTGSGKEVVETTKRVSSTMSNTPSGSNSSENSNDNDDVYCICRRKTSDDEENEDETMIECDNCKDWLHGKCVNLTQRLMADIEIYICPRCVSETKQTICKYKFSQKIYILFRKEIFLETILAFIRKQKAN